MVSQWQVIFDYCKNNKNAKRLYLNWNPKDLTKLSDALSGILMNFDLNNKKWAPTCQGTNVKSSTGKAAHGGPLRIEG